MTQLTKNFTLEELLESSVARADDITEQFTPPLDVVQNLFQLCFHLLQPLRDALGSIDISSGWRCPRLNQAVGGVPDSQHLADNQDAAADCEYHGPGGNQAIIDKVIELDLPFDQMIDEAGLKWIHLSYSRISNRKEKLRMVDGKYYSM